MMVRSAIERPSRASPRKLAPMLAQTVARLPVGPAWAYEFKWDGIRAVAEMRHGAVRIFGRNGSELTRRFPELEDLGELSGQGMMLDGEIVVMHNGRADFGRIQPRIHLTQPGRIAQLARLSPVTYMIFDLLEHDGEDLTDRPLRERRSRLESLDLAGAQWAVPPIVAGPAAADEITAVARHHGLEGVVAKRWDSTYEPGQRSGAWVKYKLVKSQEFVVGGWRPSQSGRREVGALAVGYHPDEGDPTLRFAGLVGTGFKQQDHRQLLHLLGERQRGSNPFDEALPKQDVNFVQPDLVVQVHFTEWTEQAILRHPSYKGLRHDKPAEQVVRET